MQWSSSEKYKLNVCEKQIVIELNNVHCVFLIKKFCLLNSLEKMHRLVDEGTFTFPIVNIIRNVHALLYVDRLVS